MYTHQYHLLILYGYVFFILMKDFQSYFSEEELILQLCKYRAREANKRHNKHMIRNVSVHKSSNKIIIKEENLNFKFLQSLFPSRRNWKKLNEKERKDPNCKDSLKVNQKRLFKSYLCAKRDIENGQEIPIWYQELINYINEIKGTISNFHDSDFKISPPLIKGIKKEIEEDVIIYRPIALYKLKDKIICSFTAKYLREYFELIFSELDCSFAFRPKNSSGKVPDHHACINRLTSYKRQKKELWVAECDIQKFFDTVQHNHIKKVLNNLALVVENRNEIPLDPGAKKIFNLFLDSFSFQQNILKLDKKWFKENKLPFGKFKWVKDSLDKEFGQNYTLTHRIGVPQGNAISCFIANLILHDVDSKIRDFNKDLFYVRYCDDMILMHEDKKICNDGLKLFMNEISNNYLLYHPGKRFVNYNSKLVKEKFWKSKSKLPFHWGDPNLSEENVPWVSFVGYQIDHFGRIRVRKSTLKKEIKKQILETQKIIKSLGKFNHKKNVTDQNSRLAKNQIVFRLKQKLISMAVGRVTIHNHKLPLEQGLCWTNGFKELSLNKISSKQLKHLDRTRQFQIERIKQELAIITKEVENSNFPEALKKIYFGSAFSYYNYLKHKKK